MAHRHAGNYGDFLKHVVLHRLLRSCTPAWEKVRYVDPYGGEGAFPPSRQRLDPVPLEHVRAGDFRRAQPFLPHLYLGSPLVAARALDGHESARLDLSDRDAATVDHLRETLSSDERWAAWGVRRPSFSVQAAVSHRDFRPVDLDLDQVPGELQVLLLDPTVADGYAEVVRGCAERAHAARNPVVLMAWGLEVWGLAGWLAGEDAIVAGYEIPRQPTCVVAVTRFGAVPAPLWDVAASCVAGFALR